MLFSVFMMVMVVVKQQQAAKEHLMESIVRQKNFWSDKDEDVLKAIKEGYIATHYAMWKEQEKWRKTASGLPSTAGTTASVAFIRRGKIYIGHVGDSGIILGYQESGSDVWKARPLTKDHKPENESEMSRIAQCGGKVVTKSGVPRVVWHRPRIGHKGPVRRSTPIDEIPFLVVARSLGDLWSYNSALDEFVVSPDPDTCCILIDPDNFRCLIFATDGLWNMISPANAVHIVQVAEQHNERTVLAAAENLSSQQSGSGQSSMRRTSKVWINPSKCLVERALESWSNTRMRADNTSVITLMLDPPGPPCAEVIKSQRLLSENRARRQQQSVMNRDSSHAQSNGIEQPDQSNSDPCTAAPPPAYPETGLEIVTMYGEEPASSPKNPPISTAVPLPPAVPSSSSTLPRPLSSPPVPQQLSQTNSSSQPSLSQTLKPPDDENIEKEPPAKRYTEEYLDQVHREVLNSIQNKEINQTEVASADEGLQEKIPVKQNQTKQQQQQDIVETIQINEVSSSCSEKVTEKELKPCAKCTRSHDTAGSRSLRGRNSAYKTSSSKAGRLSSESPKRKTHPTRIITRRTIGSTKREHNDPDTGASTSVESRLYAAATSSNNSAAIETPPQKLCRSRSLGPRDFTLRSSSLVTTGRSLRDRDKNLQSKIINSMIASTRTFRRLTATTRSFTSVRSVIQTCNRVKRINK